jgi:pyruvate dehydrogenase E2 component (dihydrolipoamide acetyltransferase)
MSEPVLLPDLGEGIESGDVVKLLVKEGDRVEQNQTLLEVETDKAVAEVPAAKSGRVTKILVKSGDKVKVGTALLEMDSSEKEEAKEKKAERPQKEEKKAETKKATEAKTQSQEVKLPSLGEGIEGGEIVKVLVKAGDVVEKDQTLLEIETDKAVAEIPSPTAGKITKVLVKEGDKVKVDALLLEMQSSIEETVTKEAEEESSLSKPEQPISKEIKEKAAIPSATTDGDKVYAAPATRRFARELGVNLTQVSSSGERITQEDVKTFVREGGIKAAHPLPDFSQWGPIEEKPLTSLRKKIADQMAWSWSIPMVTHSDQADITELELVRKKFAPQIKEQGGILSITSFAVKAVAQALQEFPQFNVSIDLTKNVLIQKKYFHIGIAVDTENGLLVPVIRDVDKKSLKEICLELAPLAQKARDRKVTANELQGATFTISNLGGIGGNHFTPLVNPPQAAILGISRGQMQPVWNGTTFKPRFMCPICVTYDHRIVDGADGARFTRRIAELLENFAVSFLGL